MLREERQTRIQLFFLVIFRFKFSLNQKQDVAQQGYIVIAMLLQCCCACVSLFSAETADRQSYV